MTHARSFDLQYSEAISAYTRLAKLTSVLLLFSKAISAYARLAKPNLMRTLFDYVGHPMYGASAIREILQVVHTLVEYMCLVLRGIILSCYHHISSILAKQEVKL